LTDFLNTGEFDLRNRNLIESISPAIDILIPSNIERLLYFLTNDSEKVRTWFNDLNTKKHFSIDQKTKYSIMRDFIADFCTQQDVMDTIKNVYEKNQIILDPHTAVAKFIADKYSKKRSNNPMLISSTAHYGKFPETVMKALRLSESENLNENFKKLKQLNSRSVFHKSLDETLSKPVLHKEVVSANIEEIKNSIIANLKKMKI
jgi:threonine synthase